MPGKEKLIFFSTKSDFRKWLEKNYNKQDEIWVGFYKKATRKKSITWQESVDEALCFGWIDGIRKSIDEESYKIRFTPRRKGSNWSAVNIKRINELIKAGLVTKAGLAAFNKRDVKKSERYSFEQKNVKLPAEFEMKIKKKKKAWEYFQKLSPSVKRLSTWWVIEAKREETRLKRLNTLIECSSKGEKIPLLQIGKK